jgi:transketolase
VVLIATGSEVMVAAEVADALEARGIGADVVSMPSWSHFDAQDAAYRADLLPAGTLKVSIEAGTTLGWERYVGPRGLAVGLDRFGASAPAEDLFKRFGFTAEAILPRILAALNTQGDQ